MTLSKKIETFLKEKEANGYDISNLSNRAIAMMYYDHLGVTMETTLKVWFIRIADGTIPAYESITRSIRKCRQNNKKWRKQ